MKFNATIESYDINYTLATNVIAELRHNPHFKQILKEMLPEIIKEYNLENQQIIKTQLGIEE